MFGVPGIKAEMLQQRTELEVLLRQSLDDVKAEILRMRAMAEGQDTATAFASVNELSAQDRERVGCLARGTDEEPMGPLAAPHNDHPMASGFCTFSDRADPRSSLRVILAPRAELCTAV
eukprot:Skav208466  [mRNA]  locus=scaffold1104:250867:252950:+ [translate_table: standard]